MLEEKPAWYILDTSLFEVMKTSKDNPTIPERITAVEVELKYVKEGLHDLKDDFTECSARTQDQMKSYNKELASLTSTINVKLRGSLSGKEKAAILISLITSIGAIIVALIM